MSPVKEPDRGPQPNLGRLLGRLLVLRREAAGETVTDLAARAGMSVPSLIEVEKGRANLTLKRIDRLTDLYGARLAIVDLDLLDQVAEWLGQFGNPETIEAIVAGSDTAASGVRYAVDLILSPGPIPIA